MRLLSRLNPIGGFADFWHEFRRPNPYRWPILIASFAMTGSLLAWVFWEKYFFPPTPPKVIFIQTYPEGRSDAEIVASNIANQKQKERVEAEQAARDEKVKDIYRSIGRATGMDVDAMDAQAKANAAREKAEKEAELKRLVSGAKPDAAVATDKR